MRHQLTFLWVSPPSGKPLVGKENSLGSMDPTRELYQQSSCFWLQVDPYPSLPLPGTSNCWRLPWWLRRQRVFLQYRRPGLDPWIGNIPWRKEWQPTLVLLPGKSHGWRCLTGYSPWGCKESNTTEDFTFLSSKCYFCLRMLQCEFLITISIIF